MASLATPTYNDIPPSPAAPPSIIPSVTAFPVRTKQAARILSGARTDITVTKFTDKIFVTIVQEGCGLGHFVHVPLESTDPTLLDRRSQLEPEFDGADLLPLAHLTATTVLGGGDPEVNTLGQLLGTQVASAVAARNPEEKRLLVVGMGLKRKTVEGEDFLSLLEMAMSCLG